MIVDGDRKANVVVGAKATATRLNANDCMMDDDDVTITPPACKQMALIIG